MNYLLDTHIFVWWVLNDPRLSDQVREVVSGDGYQGIHRQADISGIARYFHQETT